jgi:hypothetical protein
MEPLNKKERTGFIFKFSAVFIIGILIVLIPFYFTLRLPVYENAIMTEDFKNIQTQMKYQKDVFAAQIDSVSRIVSKYDLPNQDLDKLNADLGILLSEMEKPFVNDTSWSGRMYKNIVKSFIDLKKAKNDKIKSENEMKDCKQELEKAKEAAADKNKDTMGGG